VTEAEAGKNDDGGTGVVGPDAAVRLFGAGESLSQKASIYENMS
jgi:hypothetical protein